MVDLTAQRLLSRLAFFVASPALMVVLVGRTDVSGVLSGTVLATVAGVVVPVCAYLVLAQLFWPRAWSERVIGSLCAGYVNAGNLGLPIAAYVLGDATYIVPTLLMQLVVLQPVALAILDVTTSGRAFSWRRTLSQPFRNMLTLGTLAGLTLSLTGWELPRAVHDPLELLGGMAVPSMLLAYGIALRLGGGFGAGGSKTEIATVSVLKTFVQPLTAYLVATHLLDLSDQLVFVVTVMSALPTAQNVFTHATRYGTGETLARDVILITTVSTVPVILGLAWLLG